MSDPLAIETFAREVQRFIVESEHDPSSIDSFNALAVRLYGMQYVNVTPYRRLCESHGFSPETTRHWPDIPAVPTSAFKDFEFTSLAEEERSTVFHSSGTTERRPSKHYHDAASLVLYQASLLSWFRRHLLPENTGASAKPIGAFEPQRDLKSAGEIGRKAMSPGGSWSLAQSSSEQSVRTTLPLANQIEPWTILALTPPPGSAPHSSLVYMFNAVLRAFGTPDSSFLGEVGPEGSWRLDERKVVFQLEMLAERQIPLILLGTAFSYVDLSDMLSRSGRRYHLATGSRVLETGGYKGRCREIPKGELYDLLGHSLDVETDFIVSEYGMSELSSQAYDRIAGQHRNPISNEANGCLRRFHFPPWARFQIICPETGREAEEGQIGLLRIFDLANVRSVLAVQTEDLAIREGDGFVLLGRSATAELRGCSRMA